MKSSVSGSPAGVACGIGVAPFALQPIRPSLSLGASAALGQVPGGQIAAIGVAGGEQLRGNLSMARRARELEHRRLVTAKPQPNVIFV